MGVMMPIDQPGIPGKWEFTRPLLSANIVVVLAVSDSRPVAMEVINDHIMPRR
jgi:hypothetical protein